MATTKTNIQSYRVKSTIMVKKKANSTTMASYLVMETMRTPKVFERTMDYLTTRKIKTTSQTTAKREKMSSTRMKVRTSRLLLARDPNTEQ